MVLCLHSSALLFLVKPQHDNKPAQEEELGSELCQNPMEGRLGMITSSFIMPPIILNHVGQSMNRFGSSLAPHNLLNTCIYIFVANDYRQLNTSFSHPPMYAPYSKDARIETKIFKNTQPEN